MAEVYVVTKAYAPNVEPEQLEALYEAANAVLKTVNGFVSMSGWMSDHSESEFLILAQFESDDSAEMGAKAMLESDVLIKVIETLAAPPDSHRVRIHSAGGTTISDMGRHALMSYSVRSADPGMGPQLVGELSDVLKNLNVIDGFLGWACGTFQDSEEEVVGFAYWQTRSAFAESLPVVILYKVNLYERVF